MKKVCFLLCLVFFEIGLAAKPVAINVISIKKGSLKQEESFVGNVVFKESANIASQSSGIVKEVNFRAGQRVKKGDLLLSLNDELLQKDIVIKQASLNQALYALEKKKKDLERYKNLLETQSVPMQQYENVEYEVKSQEATILGLQAQLDISVLDLTHKVIYAPFDGIIVEQRVHTSEWVNTGDVVAQILNTKDVEVTAEIPGFMLNHLTFNQKVNVTINNRNYEGRIVALIPKANINSRNFPVYITIKGDDGRLLDGMAASIKLGVNGQSSGFLIPRDCIVQKGNKSGVFIVKKNRAKFIPIEVISINRADALIQGDLKEGEKLVLRGQSKLEDNSEVVVMQ